MFGFFGLAGCSTTPPPPPPPATPVAYVDPDPPPPPDEWNIFPDPTTGKVEVYNKGNYVGAVDGSEPPDQDPPIPHKGPGQ